MKRPATDKYQLTISPGLYEIMGFGEVDLRNLSLDRANQLFKAGFPYLFEKPANPVKIQSIAPEVKKVNTLTNKPSRKQLKSRKANSK